MDPLADKIVKAIIEDLNPAKIILFGSRARGHARPDSDVDLLLIYDGPLKKRDLKLRVHRLFRERDFSLDLFVLSSSEFQRQQNVVSTIGRVAAREGIVCYPDDWREIEIEEAREAVRQAAQVRDAV